jgi:transposase InsO family protein
MSWRESTPMEERIRFVLERGLRQETMSELCLRYGISRKTGYKWLGRFQEEGIEGLKDRPRRPESIPHKTASEIEELIVEERHRHPSWGPKKLVALLWQQHGVKGPAPSTAGDILKRRGLVKARKRRRTAVYSWPGTLKEPEGPNDLWAADFKGWFRTRDRQKCFPLTVTDQYSRYVLCCRALDKPDYSLTAESFEGLFREVGLPNRIRVDNGTPFGCPDAGHLSRLAVDWLKAGVSVEYTDPARPDQNGQHERMHRTLKEETTCPPARNQKRQQKRFDEWREGFNNLRPHEALGQVPPSTVWRKPERRLNGPVPDFEYPGYWETRRVRKRGEIIWGKRTIYIGRSYYGSTVGFRPTPEGKWMVYAGPFSLGLFDDQAGDGLIRPSPASSDQQNVLPMCPV